MEFFKTDYEWINRLAPEGIPIPSSVLLSGPGGSGKPLVGLAVVASWLRRGGKVVFIPLQYPDPVFTKNDLVRLYTLSLDDYSDSIFFLKFDVDLDPSPEAMKSDEPNMLCANLVNPATWDKAIETAVSTLGSSQVGTLIFGSAINLLLFSKTYGVRMLNRFIQLLKEDKSRTFLFTVSSTVLKEKIDQLERAADHLFFAEMSQPEGGLQLWIERLSGAPHSSEKITAPFDSQTLRVLKEQADSARVIRIPAIQKI